MSDLRVVELQASNILRLTAVHFEWKKGEPILTLGGKNAAGKSSVINALAMALGGAALCPDEPLKRGESRGVVEVNLGELIVRREFWRDMLTEQPVNGPAAYGETKSRLTVKTPAGVKQEPAQRLLDKLVNKRAFDPVAFIELDEKAQADTLRQIVGLDFTDHDEQRAIAYDMRAVYNKQYKEQLVLLDAMQQYADVPDEEISAASILDELEHADALNDVFADAQRTLAQVKQQRVEFEGSLKTARAEHARQLELFKQLQEQIAQTERTINHFTTAVDAQTRIVSEHTAIVEGKYAELIDKQPITQKLHALEDTNSKVRANTARRNVMNTVVKLQAQAEEQDKQLHALDNARAQIIRDIKFPVDGLSIAPTGAVTFNNIALNQASTAEQIRVSVAIGFALNPALKLLCVKNGNALDNDSFALVAAEAEKHGGQVLMEIVTKNADDVSVFIEDGHS